MKFDFEGARKAGLSDSEIVQYLSTLPNNGNLEALKEIGASDSHIIDLWSGSKKFSITTPQESQKSQNNSSEQEFKTQQLQDDLKSLDEKPKKENIPTLAQEQKQLIENTPQILPEQKSTTPLNTQTQEEPPKPQESFSGTLMDILNDGLGIPLSAQREKIRQKRNEYLSEKIATNDPKSYDELSDEEKNFIRNKYNEKNSFLGLRNPFALLDSNESKLQIIKKDLKEQHQIKQILDSDLSYEDLSLEQKQLINDKTSIFKKFSKPNEVFEDLKNEYQIHKVAPTIEKSISELNNISANKRLYNIFNSDPSMRDKYLQDVYNIATNAGFDNVSVNTNNHKMYLIKDDKAYELKEGFLDTIFDDIKSSKFELGASLAGAVAGSKVGATPQQKLLGGIIGGAIGAFGGAGVDYQINNWLLKRQKDSDELLGKMLEAGALSAVGDVATLGAIKLIKSGYHSLKKIPTYANELKENFTNANINGAMKLLEDVGISKSQAEAISKKMDQYVETRFVADKEDSFLDKALSKVSKINDSIKQKEKIAFDVAYADPVLWKYIGAVAKNEPKFSNFIHNSITDRAKKISLDPKIKLGDIKQAIKDYEQSLKTEYGEAIDLLDTALPKYRFYPQEFLQNKLNKIAEHIGENKSEGIIAGLNNQIKDMGEGLNVSQMIDIRKLINKTLRRNARFDYNDIGALKDINSYIDSNIEEALLKNTKSEPKLEVLYDEWKKINTKYSDYKELQDSKLYKDIFSENYNNDEKLGNAFINWSKTDERIADSIIGRLDPRMQDKTQAFILAKSIDKHIQDTLNDGKVVDFLELKKTLSHLEPKITNPSLKDHIKILKDMADLFYNDINLMRESGQINILTPNSGSGISHDLIARAHTSMISNTYRTIQRFLPTTAGKNSAFLYHLGKAMNMSRNPKELLFDLVSSADTPPSLLKELRPAIEAYNGRVGNAIDKAQEVQTQKDQQNYLDMLESSQNYERILNDTNSDSRALETMETSGVSYVGSRRNETIPHRRDTEGLLSDSGEIRATDRNRDGKFGRIPRSDEGRDRSLRAVSDGRTDRRTGAIREIPQESEKIPQANRSATRTPPGRIETKQTAESTIITQEGLSPGPMISNLAKNLKNPLESISDFGTNYPEYYHDGKGAIEKLLQTQEGQVKGAFHKEGLGDIDLIWGDEKMGLAHILEKHPEVIDKIPEIIDKGELKNTNGVNTIILKSEDGNYRIGLSKGWHKKGENNWILTAYQADKSPHSVVRPSNEVASRDGTDLPSNDYEIKEGDKSLYTSLSPLKREEILSHSSLSDSTIEKLKNQELNFEEISNQLSSHLKTFYDKYEITKSKPYQEAIEVQKSSLVTGLTPRLTPGYADKIMSEAPLELAFHNNWVKEELKEPFGINFQKSLLKKIEGKQALETLLTYKLGQVKGAFHKEGLGDIDLIWGEVTNAEKHTGYGLAHIIDKHPEVIDRIPEIINNGELKNTNGVNTIILKSEDGNYHIGLSKGWHKKGENNWILTTYQADKSPHSVVRPSNEVASRDGNNLPSNDYEVNSTTEKLKNQEPITEAFIELFQNDKLSIKTKEAIENEGFKIEQKGNSFSIHHIEGKPDKDLEPLPSPSSPKAIITKENYKEFDPLGNEIKEVTLNHNTLTTKEIQENQIITETLDLYTKKSTKQIEIQNPEVNLSITSPSSSSAPSSLEIAKLEENFKIDPLAIISKSPKKRFGNNIEAIKILKKLEKNQTLPTLEEKQKLSSYVGWGGLANSFKDNSPEDKLLRELLSKEEYIRAKNSTLSSYYTPYFVVNSMYKALQKMGFTGGEILEPSVGVGNFFGLLPDSLRHTSRLTGIELDDTTAKIAKYLYPSAKIKHMGYEEALLPKNNYDLVIGNPPYGSFSVYDKNFKKQSGYNIHNYFMLKNLALTKEDGVLAQIITTNFLDTKNPEVRELIAKEVEFLGAIRLPQGSFDDTQVATDIVFFRKLKNGEISPSKEWVNLKTIPDVQGKEDIPINSYFVDNPQYMLGIPGRYGGMYGADTVGFRANGNTQVQLQKAIEDITEGIHIDTRPVIASVDIAQQTIDSLTPKPIDDLLYSSYIRSGGIGIDKNKEIYRLNQHQELEKIHDLELIDKTQEEFDKLTQIGKKAKLAQIDKIKMMIPAISEIRDTLMKLKQMQLDPMQDENSISSQRNKLNTLYDNFRAKFHTFLSDNKIAKAFDGDPTYPHIASLEVDYKRIEGKYQAKKADIFTKRTQFPYTKPTKAQNIDDAIFISYNQTGKLDFDNIAQLLDKEVPSIQKEILSKNLAFKDAQGNIIYAPEFLSGNIIAKIKSFEGKELDEYQNKAKKALLEAVPEKVEIEGVGINMGANYIPIEIYQDFAKEVLGGHEKGVSYQKFTNEFIINFKSSLEADKTFGVEGLHKSISASDVFEAALNDRKISMAKKQGDITYPDPEGQNVLDQQIGVIKEAFRNFIYDDYSRAEKVERVYNDIFNNTKLRDFDGSFLKLEGSNDLITLRPHQKNAIYRIISSPATLLDHTVGTGKTYTMVGSAMELRRLGLAKKPLFVVPNHIVNQFGAEFARLYPNANILSTRRFDKKSRQRTLSMIATGDWDAIIIGHSNFEMLPVSKETELSFITEQINAFEEAIKISSQTGDKLSVKKLEVAKESKKEKFNKLMDKNTDNTINFEDLGIDALFLDEAHEFKNLEFFSKQNISGLSNQTGSKKAFDLFMKTRYLQDKNKKIIFSTGTPISNSIAELYTLQKYLDFKGLQEKGINSFDQWSKTFGKVETRFEYHPKGDFKLTNRFTGYINMPELIKEYKKFSDVIVNEDVEAMLKLQGKEFDLPKAEFITVEIKKSPRQEKFMQEIMERSKEIDKGKDPKEDNYLKVTTDGKKGSLDMRLLNPLFEDEPNSKVNTGINNILKEYHKWKEDKGTQLVFLDMSTPKNKSPKAKKELDELLTRITQGDEEAEEILKAKGGADYVAIVKNDGFSVYEEIKEKLIKEGIPENEIAFIHDFDTDKKKAELFTKVNDGDVRILLGSTSKMGAGTNVQERIVAIHHLDAPWRPADIEQRNGRGIRQGNRLYEKYGKDKFKVNIYTYVTKGMLDTMIFEKLHTKAKFISQLRKGELSGREIEDIGDEVLNFTEIQAATLEDKRYLQILELKREIDSLQALQKNISNINLRTNREIKNLEYIIKNKPSEIKAFKVDMESFNKAGNKVQINNIIYTRGQKDNSLAQALEGIKIDRDIQSIYKYNDFIIEAALSKRNADFGYIDLIAHSPNTDESYLIATTKKLDFKPNGALTKIDNYFKSSRLLAMQDELKNAQINLPKLKNSLKKFDKQKELEEKTKQHIKLIKDLNIQLNSHPYVGLGLFGAISGLNIDYSGDGKNDEVDMLLGALGAIIGHRGVKYLLKKNPSILQNVLNRHFPDKKEEINTVFKKYIQKEKRGIYNVAYNNKKATIIKEDLKSIENATLFESGRENPKTKQGRGYGAKHITARHNNHKDLGYVTKNELLDIGNSIRDYLKQHKEPFVDKNGARIYEWKNKEGVNFRVVIGDRKKSSKGSTTEVESEDLPLPDTRIITFYSDRNLKQKMKFKNPKLSKKEVRIW